jgi:hypothetical protein
MKLFDSLLRFSLTHSINFDHIFIGLTLIAIFGYIVYDIKKSSK